MELSEVKNDSSAGINGGYAFLFLSFVFLSTNVLTWYSSPLLLLPHFSARVKDMKIGYIAHLACSFGILSPFIILIILSTYANTKYVASSVFMIGSTVYFFMLMIFSLINSRWQPLHLFMMSKHLTAYSFFIFQITQLSLYEAYSFVENGILYMSISCLILMKLCNRLAYDIDIKIDSMELGRQVNLATILPCECRGYLDDIHDILSSIFNSVINYIAQKLFDLHTNANSAQRDAIIRSQMGNGNILSFLYQYLAFWICSYFPVILFVLIASFTDGRYGVVSLVMCLTLILTDISLGSLYCSYSHILRSYYLNWLLVSSRVIVVLGGVKYWAISCVLVCLLISTVASCLIIYTNLSSIVEFEEISSTLWGILTRVYPKIMQRQQSLRASIRSSASFASAVESFDSLPNIASHFNLPEWLSFPMLVLCIVQSTIVVLLIISTISFHNPNYYLTAHDIYNYQQAIWIILIWLVWLTLILFIPIVYISKYGGVLPSSEFDQDVIGSLIAAIDEGNQAVATAANVFDIKLTRKSEVILLLVMAWLVSVASSILVAVLTAKYIIIPCWIVAPFVVALFSNYVNRRWYPSGCPVYTLPCDLDGCIALLLSIFLLDNDKPSDVYSSVVGSSVDSQSNDAISAPDNAIPANALPSVNDIIPPQSKFNLDKITLSWQLPFFLLCVMCAISSPIKYWSLALYLALWLLSGGLAVCAVLRWRTTITLDSSLITLVFFSWLPLLVWAIVAGIKSDALNKSNSFLTSIFFFAALATESLILSFAMWLDISNVDINKKVSSATKDHHSKQLRYLKICILIAFVLLCVVFILIACSVSIGFGVACLTILTASFIYVVRKWDIFDYVMYFHINPHHMVIALCCIVLLSGLTGALVNPQQSFWWCSFSWLVLALLAFLVGITTALSGSIKVYGFYFSPVYKFDSEAVGLENISFRSSCIILAVFMLCIWALWLRVIHSNIIGAVLYIVCLLFIALYSQSKSGKRGLLSNMQRVNDFDLAVAFQGALIELGVFVTYDDMHAMSEDDKIIYVNKVFQEVEKLCRNRDEQTLNVEEKVFKSLISNFTSKFSVWPFIGCINFLCDIASNQTTDNPQYYIEQYELFIESAILVDECLALYRLRALTTFKFQTSILISELVHLLRSDNVLKWGQITSDDIERIPLVQLYPILMELKKENTSLKYNGVNSQNNNKRLQVRPKESTYQLLTAVVNQEENFISLHSKYENTSDIIIGNDLQVESTEEKDEKQYDRVTSLSAGDVPDERKSGVEAVNEGKTEEAIKPLSFLHDSLNKLPILALADAKVDISSTAIQLSFDDDDEEKDSTKNDNAAKNVNPPRLDRSLQLITMKARYVSTTLENLRQSVVTGPTKYEDSDGPIIDETLMTRLDTGIENRSVLDDNTDILNKIDEFGLPIDRFAISETEFYQGTLGDCYYLSSLAAIAFLYPEIIEDLFLRGAPQQSLFLVKFYLHGEPVCIAVDDILPYDTAQNRFAFAHWKKAKLASRSLWVMLAEKAYAKLYGGYSAIEYGFIHKALADLTGGIPGRIDDLQNNMDANWQLLLSYFKSDYILGASTGEIKNSSLESNGLIDSHAYSIFHIVEIDRGINDGKFDKYRLVCLRNPWGGKQEWTGPWSQNSIEWTSFRHKAKLTRYGNSECFWMAYEDFCRYFKAVDYCQLVQNLHCEKVSGEWSTELKNAGGNYNEISYPSNPQYLIVTETNEPTSVSIYLCQSDFRKNGEYIPYNQVYTIGMHVFCSSLIPRMPPSERLYTKPRLKSMLSKSSHYLSGRDLTVHVQLKPNIPAVVVVSTLNPKEENEFTLRFYSDKKLIVKNLN